MRILIISLLFLSTVLPAKAQQWRATVKLGAFWNSRSTQPATNEHGWPASAMGVAGVSRLFGLWELGATAGFYRYAYHIEGNFAIEQPTSPSPFVFHADFKRTFPGFAIMPFVNRHFDTGRLSWYVGAAPAFIRIFSHDLSDIQKQTTVYSNGNCFGLMLQGGCSYRINSDIDVFAEPFAEAINMPGFTGRAYTFAAGLALGCRIAVH